MMSVRSIFVVAFLVALATGCALAQETTPANAISDIWTHPGETSAIVSCVTARPSTVLVEFGASAAYGKKIAGEEKPRYVHIVRLTGLEPGKDIHCRIVAKGSDGKPVSSDDIVVKPATIRDAVRLPGGETKSPIMLDKPNTTYVLTKDLTADGTAFHITAEGVTLELDGHTVRYGKDLTYVEPEGASKFLSNGHGVFFPKYGVKKPKVLNGLLVEATPKEEKNGSGYGHNGINGNGVSGFEFAGLEIRYEGKDIRGIVMANSGGGEVHHCIVDDQGTHITNRHQGLDAIAGLPNSKVHHNLVRRVRHRGISAGSGSEIHHNEVHLDSWDTNSYGVMCYATKGANVHHNWIFGGGYHTIGIGTVSNCSECTVHDNLIRLAGSEPLDRSSEYGKMSGTNGVRLTWGGTNIEYYNNVIDITCVDGGLTRGTWFSSAPNAQGLVFRDNFVRVISNGDKQRAEAIGVCGDYREPDHGPVIYRNNRIVSNVCNLRFGDSYGLGSNTRFIGNTFVREGDDPRYATIRVGYGEYPTTGHILIDSRFEGGAGLDKVAFEGTGKRDFMVKWTVTVKAIDAEGKPIANAEVAVTDKDNKEVFRGKTDAKGEVAVSLIQYVATADGRDEHTPHTVRVIHGGKPLAEQKVTADVSKTVELKGK